MCRKRENVRKKTRQDESRQDRTGQDRKKRGKYRENYMTDKIL